MGLSIGGHGSLRQCRADWLCHRRVVTKRQVEVLCLLATGLTSRAVANRLMISEHTVIRHVTNMMTCFGAGNRLELLALAIAGGIVDGKHWPPRPTGQLFLSLPGSLHRDPECGSPDPPGPGLR